MMTSFIVGDFQAGRHDIWPVKVFNFWNSVRLGKTLTRKFRCSYPHSKSHHKADVGKMDNKPFQSAEECRQI